MEEPPYVDLPEQQPSFEAEPALQPEPPAGTEAGPADGPGAMAADAAQSGAAVAVEVDIHTTATEPAAAPPTATGAAAQPAQQDAAAPSAASVATDGVPPGSSEPAAAAGSAEQDTSIGTAPPAQSLPAAEACSPQHMARCPKLYVHAFVLITAGKRELPHTLLLDPATGQLHTPDAAPCTGIEWAYTHTNFYLNLQCSSSIPEAPDCSWRPHDLAEVSLMDWTFSNPNCWQALLVGKEVGPWLLPVAERHLGASCSPGSHVSAVQRPMLPYIASDQCCSMCLPPLPGRTALWIPAQ